MAKALKDNIIRLFDDRDEDIPELALDMTEAVASAPVSSTGAAAIDLSGKPKIIMCFGPGRSGKSTFLRWAIERAIERDDGSDLVLATVDTQRRTLKQFFPSTMSPKSAEGAMAWLERLLGRLIETQKTAAIDFGGDQTLLPILAQIPDLCRIASDAGVEIVSFNMLTPRSGDLTLLAAMEEAGFKPTATALLLNMATAVSPDVEAEFARLRKHSVYRAVVARGGVELWMPRLYAAKAVEDRGVGFLQSLNHAHGAGASLTMFDRSRVAAWLALMGQVMRPVESWLP